MWHSRLNQFLAIFCAMVYGIHLAMIANYAVDVPFWDEWLMLEAHGPYSGLSLSWLWETHNEHRIALTKLLDWSLMQTVGWDLRVNAVVNFLIFGVLLLTTIYVGRRWAPELPLWCLLAFVLFLLSPLNWENHSWCFQSQFHFVPLFFLLAVYFLFDEQHRTRTLVAGVLCAGLSMISMSAGVVGSIVLLALYTAHTLWKVKTSRAAVSVRPQLVRLAWAAGGIGMLLGIWFWGFQRPAYHPSSALPHTMLFWRHFGNMLSHAFGYDSLSLRLGLLALAAVVIPIGAELLRNRAQLSERQAALYTTMLGLLAMQASISIGRAGFGAEQAKTSRYVEIGALLIPLAAMAWMLWRPSLPRLRYVALASVWMLAAVGYSDKWDFSIYEFVSQQRQDGLQQLYTSLASGKDATSPGLCPVPNLSGYIERAKALKIPFAMNLDRLVPPQWSKLTKVPGGIHALDTAPAPGEERVVLNPSQSAQATVSGWAIDELDQSCGFNTYFLLRSGSTEIPLRTSQHNRPDVAEYLHNASYTASGVKATIDFSRVPCGIYELVLRTVRHNRAEYLEHRCDKLIEIVPSVAEVPTSIK